MRSSPIGGPLGADDEALLLHCAVVTAGKPALLREAQLQVLVERLGVSRTESMSSSAQVGAALAQAVRACEPRQNTQPKRAVTAAGTLPASTRSPRPADSSVCTVYSMPAWHGIDVMRWWVLIRPKCTNPARPLIRDAGSVHTRDINVLTDETVSLTQLVDDHVAEPPACDKCEVQAHKQRPARGHAAFVLRACAWLLRA